MEISDVYAQIQEMSRLANKELGQNYLINPKIAERMVELLNVDPSEHILEIGSGFGALSVFLLKTKYKSLTLNDVDPRAIKFLDEMVEHQKRAYVKNGSALKLPLQSYDKIIGNLPYYITNDLLEYCFACSNASYYLFMIQKEVLARLSAPVSTPEYGPLSILVSYIGKIKKEFDVSKTNFLPTPHVSSVVFSLTDNSTVTIDKYRYLQFLKRMFLHRRKTIYNNLSLFLMNKEKAKTILDKLKISILTRPEQIDPKTYLNIFMLTI